MKFLAYLRSIAATFFRRSQVDEETQEEVRSPIQQWADDLDRSGLSRPEAKRRARIEFGGLGADQTGELPGVGRQLHRGPDAG
jgi:hypothetical protein